LLFYILWFIYVELNFIFKRFCISDYTWHMVDASCRFNAWSNCAGRYISLRTSAQVMVMPYRNKKRHFISLVHILSLWLHYFYRRLRTGQFPCLLISCPLPSSCEWFCFLFIVLSITTFFLRHRVSGSVSCLLFLAFIHLVVCLTTLFFPHSFQFHSIFQFQLVYQSCPVVPFLP